MAILVFFNNFVLLQEHLIGVLWGKQWQVQVNFFVLLVLSLYSEPLPSLHEFVRYLELRICSLCLELSILLLLSLIDQYLRYSLASPVDRCLVKVLNTYVFIALRRTQIIASFTILVNLKRKRSPHSQISLQIDVLTRPQQANKFFSNHQSQPNSILIRSVVVVECCVHRKQFWNNLRRYSHTCILYTDPYDLFLKQKSHFNQFDNNLPSLSILYRIRYQIMQYLLYSVKIRKYNSIKIILNSLNYFYFLSFCLNIEKISYFLYKYFEMNKFTYKMSFRSNQLKHSFNELFQILQQSNKSPIIQRSKSIFFLIILRKYSYSQFS